MNTPWLDVLLHGFSACSNQSEFSAVKAQVKAQTRGEGTAVNVKDLQSIPNSNEKCFSPGTVWNAYISLLQILHVWSKSNKIF